MNNLREMGEGESFSPSPTYAKRGSKRSRMIVETVRRTDENATRQHAQRNIQTGIRFISKKNNETTSEDRTKTMTAAAVRREKNNERSQDQRNENIPKAR
jgi:hypothetical protein